MIRLPSAKFVATIAFVAGTMVASGAQAVPKGAATPATGSVTIVRPLTLTKTADLDFGNLTVTTGGTVVIDPNSGTTTASTGVVSIGGGPHPASFTGAASGLSLIFIQAPNAPITLTRFGGTQTMTVNNFTLEGGFLRLLTAAGTFAFRVGGTLNVASAQMDGAYSGTFDVTVIYF